MYCCEFCEIFKNTFSTEHLLSTAKSYLYSSVCSVLKSVYPNPLKRTWELPSLVVVILSKIRNKCIYKLLHYLIDRPYFILHYFAINVLLQGTWPYSEFFWSIFSGNRTEYGDLLCKSPYLGQIRENADQKIWEYGHFSCSVNHVEIPQK